VAPDARFAQKKEVYTQLYLKFSVLYKTISFLSNNKTNMKKTIKNCLRKLCCNFCFMLLGAFSKAEISTSVVLNEMTTSIASVKNAEPNGLNLKLYKKSVSKKDVRKIIASFPKKRKKIAPQDSFEIRELPKGEYTSQIDNGSNILVTKKIIVLK
jgi:hypothetical protein